MPTYQYVCNDCGESLEAVQKFSDDALTECPACGGRLRKIYSAVGVVFKGSGFYRNDSRSSASSGSSVGAGKGESSAPAASTSSSSSDSSSGSTPATTSTPASSTPAPAPATGKKAKDSKVA